MIQTKLNRYDLTLRVHASTRAKIRPPRLFTTLLTGSGPITKSPVIRMNQHCKKRTNKQPNECISDTEHLRQREIGSVVHPVVASVGRTIIIRIELINTPTQQFQTYDT